MANPEILSKDIDRLSPSSSQVLKQATRDLDGFMQTCNIFSFGESFGLSPEAGMTVGNRLLARLTIERAIDTGNRKIQNELFYWAEENNGNLLDFLSKTEFAGMNSDLSSEQDELLTDMALTLNDGIRLASQTPIITNQKAAQYVALNDARAIAKNYQTNFKSK